MCKGYQCAGESDSTAWRGEEKGRKGVEVGVKISNKVKKIHIAFHQWVGLT